MNLSRDGVGATGRTHPAFSPNFCHKNKRPAKVFPSKMDCSLAELCTLAKQLDSPIGTGNRSVNSP
jgi:hypothetical protein